MILNKRITRVISSVLATVAIAFSIIPQMRVEAIQLIGAGNIYSKLGLDSTISTGISLNADDAAMRLYYLGMINGSGASLNGGIEFNLSAGLNRVESAVFAVRLLGAEEVALREKYPHPFADVPEWASAYVGYLYRCGLLNDIIGENFDPTHSESTEQFMSYMLYALGYRIDDGDYTLYMAAEYARDIGICVTPDEKPLTRGDAAISMYNTLRSTVKDSNRVYSDILVENRAISYKDAIFLIWTRSKRETEKYIQAVGYDTLFVVPDGYYKIKSSGSDMLLNVAVSGMNNDYEGVPVTVWQNTEDITQTFRVERTERGTYYIYSAASRYGYGRVVGVGADGKMGLYNATGKQAAEFVIEGSADGTWTIETADGEPLLLSASRQRSNGEAVTLETSDTPSIHTWEFERQGVLDSNGEELAIFVANSLVVTQGAYDTFSHMNQNAIDIQPTEGMVWAPFDASVVRIDQSYIACNAVWIESRNKVRYADGSLDYMTILFMHDNDVSDLSVGMMLKHGEYFYHSGNYGVSTGKHVHVAVYRGKYHNGMKLGSGDVFIEDALYLPNDTYVYNDYGLDWKEISLAK